MDVEMHRPRPCPSTTLCVSRQLTSRLSLQAAPALVKRGADKKAVVAEAVRGCLAALSTASCLTLAEAAELALAAMSRSTNTQLRSTAAR